jgi:hypothetical protein
VYATVTINIHPSLIFVGKAGSVTNKVEYRKAPALTANIILRSKLMTGAYNDMAIKYYTGPWNLKFAFRSLSNIIPMAP